MNQDFEYKLTEYLSKFFKFSTSDGILRKQDAIKLIKALIDENVATKKQIQQDAIQTKGILIPNTYFE